MRILSTECWLDIEDAVANALSLIERIGLGDSQVHEDLQSAHITLLMLNAVDSKDLTGMNVPFCGEAGNSIFAD